MKEVLPLLPDVLKFCSTNKLLNLNLLYFHVLLYLLLMYVCLSCRQVLEKVIIQKGFLHERLLEVSFKGAFIWDVRILGERGG